MLPPYFTLSTKSMNNSISETTGGWHLLHQWTERSCVSARMRHRGQGWWASSILYQRNRTCFVFFSTSSPVSIHPLQQKFSHASGNWVTHFILSPLCCCQRVSLSVSTGLVLVHQFSMLGLKHNCFLWQQCHFLLNVLALASGASWKIFESPITVIVSVSVCLCVCG